MNMTFLIKVIFSLTRSSFGKIILSVFLLIIAVAFPNYLQFGENISLIHYQLFLLSICNLFFSLSLH